MTKAVMRAAVATTAAAVALTAAVATAGSATASPAAQFSVRSSAVAPDVNTKSKTLAGYEADVKPTKATATFVVPAETCGTALQGVTFGVGNEQTAGAPTVLADVFVACSGGTPFYEIDALAGGNDNTAAAAAGDRITLTVTQTATKVTATAKNLTQHVTATSTGTPTPDLQVQFAAFPLFATSNNKIIAPANFGTATFSKTVVNGSSLKSTSPKAFDRYRKTTLQIQTGTISATGSFTLTYVAS